MFSSGRPLLPLPKIIFATLSSLLCASLALVVSAAAAPQLTWTMHDLEAHQPSSISCASSSLCVVVDNVGNELNSTDPTAPEPKWSVPAQIDQGHPLSAVSCVAPAVCAAVDELGNILVSSDPSAGSGAWQALHVDEGNPLTAVACASSVLCVAVDGAGNEIAIDPADLARAPIEEHIDAANKLQALACPSATTCYAVDDVGNLLQSANPGVPGASWSARAIDRGTSLLSLSCLTTFCLGVDETGAALASSNPQALTPTWSSTEIDSTGTPNDVSCSSVGLCVLVDQAGKAFISDDVTQAPPTWIGSPLEAFGVPLEGVSCLAQGTCLAIDSSGRLFLGVVPVPVTVAGAASEITMSSATLSGTVNPNDALLTDCHFEYGTSTAYGVSLPCTSLPAAGVSPETVGVTLSGLEAGTIYHYRLLASSAAGLGSSSDQTFATAPKPTVSIIKPHPTITGVPAVGLRLKCNSGIPSSESPSLTYSWIRDAARISGASAASYQVKSADAKHHLQCKITATNAAGSASASSAFVAIPAQGIVAAAGETLVGKAKAEGSGVSIPLTCSPLSVGNCQITLQMTVLETLRGKKVLALTASRSKSRRARTHQVTLRVGSASLQLARGQVSTVKIPLNGTGLRLLRRAHRLPVRLAVSGTVIGSIRASLGTQRLTLSR